MDKRTAQVIINCYLDPELEDRESVRKYLINAAIDSEKFRRDILMLLREKQMQIRKDLKNRRKGLRDLRIED